MPTMHFRVAKKVLKHLKSLFEPETIYFPRPISSGFPLTASPLFLFNQLTSSWSPSLARSTHTLTSNPLQTLRILTWNIDSMSPNPPLRMHTLLAHLESLLGKETLPTIILLQEVHPEALELLLVYSWVRRNFAVTNIALSRNSPAYGTVTLVTRDLFPLVGRCFRVPFKDSEHGRDAVFVDLRVLDPRVDDDTAQNGQNGQTKSKILRVGNTHLEPLIGQGTATRPLQLATIKDFLLLPEVYAGVVGGDMNAIAVEDEGLPARIGLRDLWVRDGGQTWGYQPPCALPPGRLDKILAIGDVGVVHGTQVEFVGVGLKTGPDEGGGIAGECYVSDHYGLLSTVKLGIL